MSSKVERKLETESRTKNQKIEMISDQLENKKKDFDLEKSLLNQRITSLEQDNSKYYAGKKLLEDKMERLT